jgi:hypothetical protein
MPLMSNVVHERQSPYGQWLASWEHGGVARSRAPAVPVGVAGGGRPFVEESAERGLRLAQSRGRCHCCRFLHNPSLKRTAYGRRLASTLGPMPPLHHLIQRFCDGAVCSGHLLALADSDTANRVQEDTLQTGEATLIGYPDAIGNFHQLLLHDHSWVRYYAACLLLKHDRDDRLALNALHLLVHAEGAVSALSQVTLSALTGSEGRGRIQ